MDMLHWDSQSDKLIHEPRHIDGTLIFRDNYKIVILLCILIPKFYTQGVIRNNR